MNQGKELFRVLGFGLHLEGARYKSTGSLLGRTAAAEPIAAPLACKSLWGLGFGVLGFRVQGFRVSGLGFRVLGFRVSGLGFRVSGFRVLGFRVAGLKVSLHKVAFKAPHKQGPPPPPPPPNRTLVRELPIWPIWASWSQAWAEIYTLHPKNPAPLNEPPHFFLNP